VLGGAIIPKLHAKPIRLGVVQTVIENRLDRNLAKILQFIDGAANRGCQLVIFPEDGLFWPDIAVHKPTRAGLDDAIEQIRRRARRRGMYVIFGTAYKLSEEGKYDNRGVVFDPDGKRPVFYRKNREVPRRFNVHGAPCNLSICSDRGYLEHSDLPCLVQDSRIIIDISGGHGGDDGRPDLRWIRYRPWAVRNTAYVIVCNPVHSDTDFMGHSPWGGGSAIVRPDGSLQASLRYEKDTMIVEEIDPDLARRTEAKRRRNHPTFKSFWDMGKELLEKGRAGPVPEIMPYTSPRRRIKIAAAQMACSRNLAENTRRILRLMTRAAGEMADVVVFPELAVTGFREEDVLAADPSTLEAVLEQMRDEARRRKIHVILGMPYFSGGQRKNCAFVLGDDGGVKTRYDQIVVDRGDLFRGGTSTRAMWFTVKGVRSIVTVGGDANWVEIADLAANRGMILHFHLCYESDSPEGGATLRKQKNLLFLRYARYGAVVNAADPSSLPDPSSPAHGKSMIVSREGGHNRPPPEGIEYYLPYQTSIVKSAGAGELLISAIRETGGRNNLDLRLHWRNRERASRTQKGWQDWIRRGTQIIEAE